MHYCAYLKISGFEISRSTEMHLVHILGFCAFLYQALHSAVCSTRCRSGDGMCQNLHNPSNLIVWRSCVSNLKGSNKFSNILKYQDRFAHVLIWKYALEILYLYMFITEQFSLIILWRSWDSMFCMPWGFMFLNLSRSTQFSFRVLCRSGGSKF